MSSKYPPLFGAIWLVARPEEAAWTISFADLLVLPWPFDTFVNPTAGPYPPCERRDAFAFRVRVIVTPRVSVVPKVGLAVSQAGVLIEYLTVPVVELTRNSKSEGENGPPGGPEKDTLLAGDTINDG